MNIFLQHINYFSEGRHDPESEEHRLSLLHDADPHNIPKDKNHEHYEDKIHNGLKGLKHSIHGEENVGKLFAKYHDSSNAYVRLGVAKNPEIHNYPEIVEKLKNDRSSVVARAVGGSPVKVPKTQKSSSDNPNIDPSIHPEGKFEAVAGSDADFKGADKVTHLYHISQERKRTKVGSVVSKGDKHEVLLSNGKPLETNAEPISHKGGLVQLINNHRGYR